MALSSSGLFFTYQPFWNTNVIKEERLLTDENGAVIAKVCRFQDIEDFLSVPGIGLTSIHFPYGVDAGKTAYCYGPVQKLGHQPTYGVRCFYAVRFLPGAFGRYFRVSNNELPSGGIPLTDLMPDLNPFIQRAADSDNINQFCLVIQQMLNYLSGRCRNNNISPELTWLLSLDLLRYRGNVTVQSMADNTGFCRRHLRDMFLMYVGVSPKQLCSQIRFQNTMQDIIASGTAESKLVDISLHNGYFDQSHLNREFKRYTGMCPSKFIDFLKEKQTL